MSRSSIGTSFRANMGEGVIMIGPTSNSGNLGTFSFLAACGQQARQKPHFKVEMKPAALAANFIMSLKFYATRGGCARS